VTIVTEFALVKAERVMSGQGQHERRFLDFAFDSTPVYETVRANGFNNLTPIWLGDGS